MNLIAAFQYATLQFTQALMNAGVQLSMNTTSLRGTYNKTVEQPVTYDTYDTNEAPAVTAAYEAPVVTAAYEAPEITTEEPYASTTAAYVVDTINTTNSTNSTNQTHSSGSKFGRGVLMNEVHLGILMLMCAMLLILVLTCCIRCIRQKGKLRTVPRRMVRQASVRPAGR